MDQSCAIVALDRGAAAILNYHRDRNPKSARVSAIEKELTQAIHGVSLPDLACMERVFRIGTKEFTCRGYVLQSHDTAVPQPLIALILERQWEARDAIDEVGAQYHLTDRERQALRGLSMGLSSKELAARMNIRPSTLRAFLRLVKIKMGVTTRAGIMAKILQKTQS
jgi:DNA-binding CsgD family transcriptional regulator